MKSAVIPVVSQQPDKSDDFAVVVRAILALPLSDAEKAEAVRRLLTGRKATNATKAAAR